MKVSVSVKPNSKKEMVEQIDDKNFVIKVHAPPVEGEANKRVIELLSQHLGIAKSSIQLISGRKSKKKVFEIL